MVHRGRLHDPTRQRQVDIPIRGRDRPGSRHARRRRHQPGKTYIAGIDFAGEEEQLEDEVLTRPGRDATVATIAELIHPPTDALNQQPTLKVVETYSWVGVKHSDLYPQLVDIIKNVWPCARVVCDATGIGEPITAFIRKALGPKVQPFKFSQSSKSEAGFDLLAAINSGRLKLYRQDGSPEYQDTLHQLQKAKSVYRPNQTLNFFVEPSEGHDDHLISLALLVQASKDLIPRKALGGVRND